MIDDFARAQNHALRLSIAKQTGCELGAFSREELTIVRRPEPPLWPFTAAIVTFGTGTVVSATEPSLDWARAQKLEKHFYAFSLAGGMVAEASARGIDLEAWPPGMGWSLARAPEAQAAPAGMRLARFDKEWMAAQQQRGGFENACGQPEQAHRTWRNRFAIALMDENDTPAAIAGVFDTGGLWEIGIDVARAHRGKGLAPIVVSNAARAILDAGETPYYACGAGNIRSQRTAMASGFVPACGMAFVVDAHLGA